MSGSGFDPLAGQASGSQAQFGTYLKLFTRLVVAVEALNRGSPYTAYPFTGTGNIDIATAFPGVTSGTIVVRKAVAAPTTVTLPTSGGPWTVADGNGGAAANNITIAAPGGFTIDGAATYVISTNWGSATFVLDGNNYIVVAV